MLRNIFYDKRRSIIHQWLYDENGEPLYRKNHFKPYIYIRSVDKNKIDGVGIDDVELTKKEFLSEKERSEFLKTYKGQVYFNLSSTQQYLLEKYYTKDISELTSKPLRTFYYDIEVIADEFPDPKDAKFEITSITIYDNFTKKYYVWGIKPYNEYSCKDHLTDISPEEIHYSYCLTEKELFKRFIKFWRDNFPDLIVGYNSYCFDLPYIVHRIEKIFGEGKASKLSPIDIIYGTEKENKFSQTYTEYTIGGVSHLDYMVLYKTFTPGERESDSLDFVCKEELNIGKLDYGDTSLQDLSVIDWDRFINYNIWDVKLMVLLDEKRKYIDIAKFSAFSGFCNIDKALGKVAIITGIIAKQGLMKNKIITTQSDGEHQKIPGGFVKEPEPGMYENVIVMDLNSLYPNTIITLNISPETKIARIENEDDKNISIYLFKKNQRIDIPKEKFKAVLRHKNWCVSASGIIFNQNKKGLCAEFVDDLYQKRKSVKNQMLLIESRLASMDKNDSQYKIDKTLADQLDTEQYLYKILLNSTYGVLANRFFALYDLDCAKSVTLTGQALIQQSDKIANDYIVEEWNLDVKDRVLAEDTDSAILSINDVLKKTNSTIVDVDGNLTPEFIEIENKISANLNNKVVEWAKETFNTNDCRFEFKRESACPKAIWVGKKHYVMHIRNSEGVKMDKLKYKGLSVVKSTYSDSTKNITKGIVKDIFQAADKKRADNSFFKSYDEFFNLPVNQIAVRSSLKTLKIYSKNLSGFSTEKGCPRHAKWSIYYNELLRKLNLSNKYPIIEEGKKIKLVYLKPNIYNIDGIAYLDELPPEFNLIPDREKMFQKCVINCLEPIFNALKWHVPDPKKQYEFSLEEIFG
jgi:DNA polymerase elongation subunit (family B)